MTKQISVTIEEQIRAFKAEKDAAILAHNYQTMEVQQAADHVGDSLQLARVAAGLKEKVVVFAGVHFMAETVSILSPEKTVLLPDPEAGCFLADMITAGDIRAWRGKHPGGLVVSYVNTSAEVKAESDYCCTSANACQVVNALPKGPDVLFVPDANLGWYAQKVTGRKLHLWNGHCYVHHKITDEILDRALKRYPKAELLVHPECRCTPKAMAMGAHILSTGGMLRHVKASGAKEFLIGTEIGLIEQLRYAHHDKVFHPVDNNALCIQMKMTSLEKVLGALEHMKPSVRVPAHIAGRARKAIERMIAIS